MMATGGDTELTVQVANRPGAEGRILSMMTDNGVNVLALCSYNAGDRLVVLLVPDKPRLAKQALMSTGFDCRLNSIVTAKVQNRIGALAGLGAQLKAAGIEILYSYASYNETGEIFAVFKTSDNVLAHQTLEETRQSTGRARMQDAA